MHSGGCTLGAASRSERQAGCASWAAPCFPKARRPLWQSIETLILQFSALPLLVERLQGAPQCMQATTRWTGAASGAGRDGTWNASPAHLPVTEAARHLGVMVYDVKHDAAALEPVAWQKRGGGGGGDGTAVQWAAERARRGSSARPAWARPRCSHRHLGSPFMSRPLSPRARPPACLGSRSSGVGSL